MAAAQDGAGSSWTGGRFAFGNCDCVTCPEPEREPSYLDSVLAAPRQLAAAAFDAPASLATAAANAVSAPPPRPPLHRRQSTATAMLDEAFALLSAGDPPRVPASEVGELLYLVTRRTYEPERYGPVALALDPGYEASGLDEAACGRLVAHFQEFL